MVKNGRPGLPREVRVRFWDGIRAGLGSRQAAVAAGISHPAAWRLMQLAGGVAANGPRAGTGRRLCLAERFGHRVLCISETWPPTRHNVLNRPGESGMDVPWVSRSSLDRTLVSPSAHEADLAGLEL